MKKPPATSPSSGALIALVVPATLESARPDLAAPTLPRRSVAVEGLESFCHGVLRRTDEPPDRGLDRVDGCAPQPHPTGWIDAGPTIIR
jgi:hypothetical protein